MKKLVTRAQQALAMAVAFGPAVALAAGPAGVPTAAGGGRAYGLSDILRLMNSFATFLITAAVIIAVIVIVYGGLLWMTKGKEQGKTFVVQGIIGVAIVMGVGVILATVSRVVSTGSLG